MGLGCADCEAKRMSDRRNIFVLDRRYALSGGVDRLVGSLL